MTRTLLAVVLLAGAASGSAAAQDLDEARRMAQQGQVDSARAVLARLLAATPAIDPRYPEILYVQGGLAASTAEMQRAFQRVALEYPNSDWADDAILRLAQIEYAVNDPQGALRQVERLRADYPASPLRGIAALWGARAHFAMNNTAAGCVLLAEGLEQGGGDVELRNQLEFHRGRCPGLAAGPVVSAAEPPQPTQPPTEEPPGPPAIQPSAEPSQRPDTPSVDPSIRPSVSGWRVQLAALASRATADGLAEEVRGAGYGVAVVAEGGLFKVRAGPWVERAEAASALERLRARFGGQPFLVRP